MEIDIYDRSRIDYLFSMSLPQVPNVDLWNMYLDYIRRVFPLIPDPNGESRAVVLQCFEAVLDAVGTDPDSGKIWREYIEFIKSYPGTIGGTGWQDQQKGDLLRKAYQRAIRVPTGELIKIWKEYDNFEISFNKAAGRKILNDQSPHYMSARGVKTKMEDAMAGLGRKSFPVLPPLEGFEGDDAFAAQVMAWRRWIDFEKEDPLTLAADELPLLRKRIIYAYKHACIQLRFYPTIWYDAAQWCFEQAAIPCETQQQELQRQGEEFLKQGIAANPESVLLALKEADRIELNLEASDDDETIIANGDKLNVPFETCHTALYALREMMAEREKRDQQAVKDHFDSLPPEEEDAELPNAMAEDDDDDDGSKKDTAKPKTREELKQSQLKAVADTWQARIQAVRRLISHVWIAKMRAFRRVQGQGMPKKPKKGFRGTFDEARPRGQLTSDVYIASALMEWHCYKDGAANKIFERGLKLFPTDERFALEYIKHMIAANNDITNARVVFETTVTKILAIKDSVMDEEARKRKVRPLLGYMHHYEAEYGELSQMQRYERRMKELFPHEPEIERFSNRFIQATFDPMGEQIVLSPTQARPKTTFLGRAHQVPNMEPPVDSRLQLGPNGPYLASTASPKRPLEDADEAETPTRKFQRAESPLKGLAGRRVQQPSGNPPMPPQPGTTTTSTGGTLTTITGSGAGGGGFMIKNYVPANAPAAVSQGPKPLAADIERLLAVLPNARTYDSAYFLPERMVDLLRRIDFDATGVRARVLQAGMSVQAKDFRGLYGMAPR
jgi:cleavage stimulation factor subunit 3